MRLEPTPATTAAPRPSESGDITTAPQRLLKNKFHGTVLCLMSLNDPSDRVCFFGALAHSLYTRNSLDLFSEVLASVLILGRNSLLKFV